MPFGLQPLHLVVVFVVALLIFGPQRLPEIGRGVGRAINEFRQGMQGMTESLRDEMNGPTQVGSSAGRAREPQPAGGNYCIHCGAPNAAEARFCNQCGQQLAA